MGFFSSRKPATTKLPADDKSVAHVIRSRFYGSRSAKAREAASENPASAPDLTPSAERHQSSRARADRNTYTHHTHGQSTSTSDSRSPPSKTIPSRASTDVLTMTLAQRLNELSVANSQGLLDDDEYRLLRQNLFERLASGSAVPTEAPIVRLNATSNHVHTRHASSSRTATTSYTESSRTPSIQSKTSVSSTVTSIFRRAAGRRSASSSNAYDNSDTTSVFSHASRSSSWNLSRKVFTSSLYKKGSEISLVTDTKSIAPQGVPASSLSPTSAHSHSLSRSATRSARRLAGSAPPSAFPGRSDPQTLARRSISGNIDGTFDNENLESSQTIRAEIEQVEAEGRRLLDAFNGLELSTLTKHHRRTSTLTSPVSGSGDMRDDTDHLNGGAQGKWTLVPETRSIHRGDDGMSVHSVGTTMSGAKSMRSAREGGQISRMLPTSGPALPSVTRKSSFSSTSSRGTSYVPTSPIPPVPGIPSVHRGVVHVSRSNGHLKLASVKEGDGKAQYLSPASPVAQANAVSARSGGRKATDEDVDLRAMEKELGDIRRRKAEVTARYDARLEYLRAKLKGAELRERLLKS
ncbi:hypothetical protein NEOLEDRAFT_1239387 [Neolentinus lepideus HHB14362 ss-1]|uniref:Uncharacterized protein n=1 Tax=Neolentinus lepideus HHB14362 ss-1 TaxID=1314782 RepID=A0A165UZ02_9AGAM|nr:hypothetical protein NEOLEDRAFT_1239387 [Neolentinus lepideus HHB14362 ss-1]